MEFLVNYDENLHDALRVASHQVARINHANGFYDKPRDFDTDIALLHSEVSEAFEAWRKNETDHIAEEMADIFIRLLDSCDRMGIDLAHAFAEKCKINAQRPYRHGNKIV
jgi:NTP pyrophosphatase (non-canonical NTP hydrolase)